MCFLCIIIYWIGDITEKHFDVLLNLNLHFPKLRREDHMQVLPEEGQWCIRSDIAKFIFYHTIITQQALIFLVRLLSVKKNVIKI